MLNKDKQKLKVSFQAAILESLKSEGKSPEQIASEKSLLKDALKEAFEPMN